MKVRETFIRTPFSGLADIPIYTWLEEIPIPELEDNKTSKCVLKYFIPLNTVKILQWMKIYRLLLQYGSTKRICLSKDCCEKHLFLQSVDKS